jgi:hypothetical protein
MSVHPVSLDAPIISGPGAPAISAVGTSLVVHEWTGSGPSYMHVHRSDDEVLEGSLRFRFADGEVDAPAGTTVFVPAGSPHAYWETEPSRYLIFLTPRLDRLISRLHSLTDQSQLRATCRIRHRAGGIMCLGRGSLPTQEHSPQLGDAAATVPESFLSLADEVIE